ncbi:hypothetical protein HYV73_01390 [Candidatus Uhrbacteria bacterium]|nr:hypothetical protein [Candidatus Uhrbacteria bacterium]
MPSSFQALDVRRGLPTISMFAVIGAVLAVLLSLLQPLRYSSTARLLVQQQLGVSVDAYTTSRSEERIADNLVTLLYTTTFFDQVMQAGFSIDQNTFPSGDRERRRAWQKAVDASVMRGTGVLTLTAYHQDVAQAEQLVRAVSQIFVQNVGQYTSGGNVTVRLIDAPLNSRFPVKPNFLINAFSGFIIGLFGGVGFVLLKSERIRRRHQITHGGVG